MKICVLGSNGMLGRYVSTYLSKENTVVNLTRNELDAEHVTEDDITTTLIQKGADSITFDSGDVIVNCIGMIKPQVDKLGPVAAIQVNSLFPRRLANVGEGLGAKVIHITTDCVWSGKDGNYCEDTSHDALDVYGKTKSLGEPENCTVIRTSIIGEEVNNSRSLVEWIKSRKDLDANGFTNHKWNGVTCLELAKCINDIIKNNNYWLGVRHVFSPTSVTKDVLLKLINDTYDLNITINNTEATSPCDRTLSTKYPRDQIDRCCKILELEHQIKEMKLYEGLCDDSN